MDLIYNVQKTRNFSTGHNFPKPPKGVGEGSRRGYYQNMDKSQVRHRRGQFQ